MRLDLNVLCAVLCRAFQVSTPFLLTFFSGTSDHRLLGGEVKVHTILCDFHPMIVQDVPSLCSLISAYLYPNFLLSRLCCREECLSWTSVRQMLLSGNFLRRVCPVDTFCEILLPVQSSVIAAQKSVIH